MEDSGGIPEDLRCKRSDGKQWRCSALSMPDKTVCEKHYIQAKRRAMNSAMRASMRKASKRKSLDNSDIYTDSRRRVRSSLSPVNHAGEAEVSGLASIPALKKHKGRLPKRHVIYSPERSAAKGSPVRGGVLRRDVNSLVQVLEDTPSSNEMKNFTGNGTRFLG